MMRKEESMPTPTNRRSMEHDIQSLKRKEDRNFNLMFVFVLVFVVVALFYVLNDNKKLDSNNNTATKEVFPSKKTNNPSIYNKKRE